MMSDHWKLLANLLGTPGPADPPETQSAEDQRGSEASAPKPAGESLPSASAPQEKPAAQAGRSTPAARKRSSMWGDDPESEEPSGRPSAVSERPTEPRGSEPPRARAQETASQPLAEMTSPRRESPVPGFELPEPPAAAPQPPPKRSAWDALIGSLGIKPAAETESKRAPAPAPATESATAKTPERTTEPRDVRKKDTDKPDEFGGFGAGLVDWDDEPEDSPQTGSTPEYGRASGGAEEDRPRGRGRRGGARNRGRGRESEREPAERQGSAAWDEPLEPADLRSGPPEASAPRDRHEEPSRGREPRRGAADEGLGDDDRRHRRPRRRGQRQTLSLSDIESDAPAAERSRARSGGEAPQRSDRGDDDQYRERPFRSQRSDEPRSERSARPPARGERSDSRADRSDEGRRGEPRGGRPRPAEDRVESIDDDLLEGFGEGLGTAAPSAGTPEDGERRPRRRRGRRGRGGGAARQEDAVRSDDALEPEIPWGPISDVPEFDDDLEDDEEAEQIRRRSRGGRSRTGRREAAPSDRGEESPAAFDSPSRSGGRQADPKERSVPTWLDTVTLLVDANIQRRRSGGGGSSRGQQGRGGGGGGRR